MSAQGRGPVRLQPLARAKVASLGATGAAWAEALPTRLDELEQQWSLTLGRGLPGGSASYVVRARTANGSDAVLKISLPDLGFSEQVAALRRARGRGYVGLLKADLGRSALLLESLGPSLEQSRRPVPERLALLADTLALAWQPVAELAEPFDKAGQLRELTHRTWAELGRPCPEAVVVRAWDCAERLRHVAADQLAYVHGDPHPGNLLAVVAPRVGAETGYCFVDPDGFVADRAYDLGVVLRDWSSHLGGPGGGRCSRATASCSPGAPGSPRSGSGSGPSWSGCPPASTSSPSAPPGRQRRSCVPPSSCSEASAAAVQLLGRPNVLPHIKIALLGPWSHRSRGLVLTPCSGSPSSLLVRVSAEFSSSDTLPRLPSGGGGFSLARSCQEGPA